MPLNNLKVSKAANPKPKIQSQGKPIQTPENLLKQLKMTKGNLKECHPIQNTTPKKNKRAKNTTQKNQKEKNQHPPNPNDWLGTTRTSRMLTWSLRSFLCCRSIDSKKLLRTVSPFSRVREANIEMSEPKHSNFFSFLGVTCLESQKIYQQLFTYGIQKDGFSASLGQNQSLSLHLSAPPAQPAQHAVLFRLFRRSWTSRRRCRLFFWFCFFWWFFTWFYRVL